MNPLAEGGPARARPPGTSHPASYGSCTVRARFQLSETPVVAVQPGQAAWGGAVAVRTLAVAGRSYQGGLLHLRTYGRVPRTLRRALAAAQRRATVLAVESTLRGGRGTARVRVRAHHAALSTDRRPSRDSPPHDLPSQNR